MKRPIWFKAKTYGWGWTPATWQGWLIIGIFILLIVGNAYRIDALTVTQQEMLAAWLPDTIVSVVLLVAIVWLTGEKPGWHWGKEKKK